MFRSRSAVIPSLKFVKLSVLAFRSNKVGVRTVLGDTTLIEHDDEVGEGHGGETMGDEECNATYLTGLSCRRGVALEQLVFCCGVEGGGGLIEYEYEWLVSHHCSSCSQALPLPTGEVNAAWPLRTELRVEPVGKIGEHTVRSRRLQGLEDPSFVLNVC